MHPTLLVGPADWDPARMPREEFLARISALWSLCDETVAGAIVYGNRCNHAELAYLTNFTPKLEPALALIPREGEPRLLVGGGINMLPAAKPLTWVEDILPLKGAKQVLAAWLSEIAGRRLPAGGRLLLIGGAAMRSALHQEILGALRTGVAPEDATARLWSLMRRKSVQEMAAIRDACATLAAAVAALGEAKRSGAGVTAAILAAEHAAHRRGAQDVRTLFSRDGGRTLEPYSVPVDEAVDPLQVYVAVRQTGYWVEGFLALADYSHPPSERSRAALRAVIAIAKAGTSYRELERAIAAAASPYAPHPITLHAFATSIGLASEEPGRPSPEEALAAGGVYSLRVGISDARQGAAIVSAMIAINEAGNDVLWSAP